LLSPVAPIKKFVDKDFANLDLNTTARKELKKLIVLTSYLDLGSYIVVTFDVAHEIGGFELPEKPKEDEKAEKGKPPSRPTSKRKGKKPSSR